MESLGRTDHGVSDLKGLVGGVSLAGRRLRDWTAFPFPMDNLTDLAAWDTSSAEQRGR